MNRLLVAPRQRTASRRLRAALGRYGLAMAAMAIAIALRLGLRTMLGSEVSLILPLAAVVAGAVVGGVGPALLAVGLGILAEGLVPLPREKTDVVSPAWRFLIEGVLAGALGAWLYTARRRVEAADIANADLEKQMLDIGDKERRRFGHDLHDGLGQQLTGIALLSESLSHRLRGQSSPLAGQAEQISVLVSETIGWTRDLAKGLSPLTLETDGLVSALQELSTSAGKLFGIACTFDCEHDELPVDAQSLIHVYRIIQEAVSNSVKHGKAKHVRIRGTIDKGDMVMTVLDDGSGLSAKTVAQPGIGLRIMQYRANLIGARLSVARAAPAGGTIVSCSLPARKIVPLVSSLPERASGDLGVKLRMKEPDHEQRDGQEQVG